MEKQKNKAKREYPDKTEKQSIFREEFNFYSNFLLGGWLYVTVACVVYFFLILLLDWNSVEPDTLEFVVIGNIIAMPVIFGISRNSLRKYLYHFPDDFNRARAIIIGTLVILGATVMLTMGLLTLINWICTGYLQC